jgi:LacI family transcriptional regulator
MKNGKSSPTLIEISRLSGVSRSTVSRVINNDPHVTEETRQSVLKVIRELHYQPNAAARSLKVGRTHIIGLVIPTGVSSVFTDPYYPMLIRGISTACQAKSYSVMLWLAEPEYERRTINQMLLNGFADGVIVSSSSINESIVEDLARSNLPFILIGRPPTHPELNYVDVENQRAASEAVNHLLRLGKRRIASIVGPQNTIVGIDRKAGYLEALHSRGVQPDPDLIVEGDFSEDSGFAAMHRLLPHKPEAVFAASDAMALGAMRACREAGMTIPDDIAVVGFDDMPFSARALPPLTTMRQPIQQIGSVAAETLIDIIENPDLQHRHHIILTAELVIRQSCGSSRST